MTQQTATPYEIRDAHARGADEALDALQATESGLSTAEAADEDARPRPAARSGRPA